jgi:hypothetical protein
MKAITDYIQNYYSRRAYCANPASAEENLFMEFIKLYHTERTFLRLYYS